MDNHVTARTDLPNEMIIASQGKNIFCQELPRVSILLCLRWGDSKTWNLLPELVVLHNGTWKGGICVSNTGTISIPVPAHLCTLLGKA